MDGIWLEGEHGGVDYADLGNLTRACDLWGKTSVVRVMDNDYATIYRTLDRGAQGIWCPTSTRAPRPRRWWRPAKFAPLGKRGMYTSRQGFGVDGYLKTANDQSLLIVLIEDIVGGAQSRRDPQGRATSTSSSWRPATWRPRWATSATWAIPEVQQTIDGAIKKIVQSGRVAGTLVSAANVERYTKLGVRAVMTSFFPWIQAGAKDLIDRAAAGAKG